MIKLVFYENPSMILIKRLLKEKRALKPAFAKEKPRRRIAACEGKGSVRLNQCRLEHSLHFKPSVA
jgi:hypothetical protein